MKHLGREAGMFVMLAAMVLSVSRGGLLFGLPAALALVLILWLGRTGVWISVGGFVLEGIILIPLSMFVPRIRDMLDTSSGSSSSFYRTEVWRSTFQMLRDHPFTGVGLDQFLYKYRGHYIQPSAWAQPWTTWATSACPGCASRKTPSSATPSAR